MYDIKSTGDLQDALKDLMGDTIQNILEAELNEWQNRRLSEVYPIVFIDAIVFNARKDKIAQKCAVYKALGIDADGKKDVLSVEIGGNESEWLL